MTNQEMELYEDLCDSHGEALIDELLSGYCQDCEEVRVWMNECYEGGYPSKINWAREYIENMETKDIPDIFVTYFDYDAFARDCEIGGDYTFVQVGNSTHVFSNH